MAKRNSAEVACLSRQLLRHVTRARGRIALDVFEKALGGYKEQIAGFGCAEIEQPVIVAGRAPSQRLFAANLPRVHSRSYIDKIRISRQINPSNIEGRTDSAFANAKNLPSSKR